MIGVKHAISACCYKKPQRFLTNLRIQVKNSTGFRKRESTLLKVETNSVILPEPRWHGFLENLV